MGPALSNGYFSVVIFFFVSLFRECRSVSFRNNLVSSAKSMIGHALLLITFDMLLIFTKNSNGPKTVP